MGTSFHITEHHDGCALDDGERIGDNEHDYIFINMILITLIS